MIPNVVRGARMAGLLAYLQGPGEENEHTYPHVVAGHDAVTALGHIEDPDLIEAMRQLGAGCCSSTGRWREPNLPRCVTGCCTSWRGWCPIPVG